MGLEELLNSLKKNEQKQIDSIRDKARSEADIIGKEIADEIAQITQEHDDRLTSACQKSVRSIFSEAEIKAREKKLYAYQALEKALYGIALTQLSRLREQKYKEVFTCLVQELPERQWEEIMVNPSDVELAAEFYDRKNVRPDPDISGGIRALAAYGKVVADNTFEKRLERKWLHILPVIINKIEKQYEEPESSENT